MTDPTPTEPIIVPKPVQHMEPTDAPVPHSHMDEH